MGRKHWEKEKLLITSNFSFSQSVFKKLVSQGRQKVSLCGNGLTGKVISWRSVIHVFPGFLTPVLTQFFFPKPPNTILTCFCRGKRPKYARKKSRLNRGSNSQPPGHEYNTLTTDQTGQGDRQTDRQGKTTCLPTLMRVDIIQMTQGSVLFRFGPEVKDINNNEETCSVKRDLNVFEKVSTHVSLCSPHRKTMDKNFS